MLDMKSVRFKILMPVLAVIALAVVSAAALVWTAQSGFSSLAETAEKGLSSSRQSLSLLGQFERADAAVADVLAMNTIQSAETIRQNYETKIAPLSGAIDALKALTVSDEAQAKADELAALVSAWRANVRIVLGLDQSGQVPTSHLIDRQRGEIHTAIEEFRQLIAADVTSEMNAAESAFTRSILIALGLGGLLSLGCGVMAWRTAHNISSPLIALGRDADALSKGDLNVAVGTLERDDEIGLLDGAMGRFKAALVEQRGMREEADRERAQKEKRANQMDALIKDFHGQIADVLKSLSSAVHEMEATAQDMSHSVGDAKGRSEEVVSAARAAGDNVREISSSSDELLASITNIGNLMRGTNETVRKADARTREMEEQVEELTRAVDRISEAMGLITEIANQTNLLALNATIEAARAGELGKGFAVVASEVKALSTQTQNASDEVRSVIDQLQKVLGSSVTKITESREAMQELGKVSTEVEAAIEQQSTFTSHITSSVHDVARGTEQVVGDLTQVNDSASKATELAGRTHESARQLMVRSEEIDQFVKVFLDEIRAA